MSFINFTVEMKDEMWKNVLEASIVGGGSFLSAVLILGFSLFLWSRKFVTKFENKILLMI